ncbi:MAG: hypothetical protein K0S12_2436, partial [Bacteroidetes bacterium]|nr:hypothetical protein [Bacteroidota bacterium]
MSLKKGFTVVIAVLIALVLLPENALSQSLGNLTHNWSRAAFSDTTGGKCVGLAIVRDNSNNLYVAGTYSGVADFDPSASVSKMTSTSTADDIFIAKYSPSGNFIYAKSIGGTGTRSFGALAIDTSGYLYVCGGFNGTTDFDPSASTVALTSSGSGDGFIAKFDLNGTFLYVNQIGSSGAEFVSSVVVNAGGFVYATGNFQGTSDFDPSAATFNLTSAGNADIFVAKYSSAGSLVFAKNAGGTLADIGTSIAMGKQSAIHITGYFSGICDFDP